MKEPWSIVESTGVVAVLVVGDAEHAVPLAEALCEGGVGVMELTLRTPVAFEALKRVKRAVPGMVCGLGTVLDTDQVKRAADEGAAFAVAPGMNPTIIQSAAEIGIPFAPGVCTPSDIEAAVSLGCAVLKFFPAEPSGGLDYLKSMGAPYAHLGLRYMPLGGLSASNIASYLAHPWVLGVGGSWIAPPKLIEAEDWSAIRERAASAAAVKQQLMKEQA